VEISCRFVWKIDNFDRLMTSYSVNTALGEPKEFSLPIPGVEDTAVMTIVCTPRRLDQDRYGNRYSDAESVELTVEFKFSSLISNPVTQVSIGLLDRNDQENNWPTYRLKEAHVYRAYRSHMLLEESGLPMPSQLTFFVKVTNMVWPHEGVAKTGANLQLQAVFRICIHTGIYANMDPDPALHMNAYPT
jgi:hypothetical protein